MELRILDLSVHCCQQPVKLCRHVVWPTVRVLNKAQLTCNGEYELKKGYY